MVKLPDYMQEYALRDLSVGESAWTSTNAIHVNCEGDMFLRGFFTYYKQRTPSALLEVHRTVEGCSVDFTFCQDAKFTRSLVNEITGFIPITSIMGVKEEKKVKYTRVEAPTRAATLGFISRPSKVF